MYISQGGFEVACKYVQNSIKIAFGLISYNLYEVNYEKAIIT